MNRLSRLARLAAPTLAWVLIQFGAPSPASAQIEITVQLPEEDDPDSFIDANEDDVRRFFNRAKCECNTNFGAEFFIPDQTAVPDGTSIEIWLGNRCDDEEQQLEQCGSDPVQSFGDRTALLNPVTEPIGVREIADPINQTECASEESEPSIYALVDETNDGIYELVLNQSINLDLQAPPEFESVAARGSEGGFAIDWTLPDSQQDEFADYQVLCAKANGEMALDEPSNEADYETPSTVCGADALDQNGDVVTGIDALDPAFVCGETSAPANSLRVTGLPDDPAGYRVFLIAIDQSRNPSAVDLGIVIPEPVQDFWEEYRDQGGTAEGGYCFVATATYGDYDHPHVVVLRDFRDDVLANFAAGRWFIQRYYETSPPIANVIAGSPRLRFLTRVVLAPVVVASGAWVYSGATGKLGLCTALLLMVALLTLRRRKRRAKSVATPVRRTTRPRGRLRLAFAALTAAALVVTFAGDASAQQEYLDELTEDAPPPELGGPSLVKWNMELRFGLFTPDVDSEFSGEGPFEKMFGDGRMLMSKIALERFVLRRFGQLGVSFGAGYFSTGADSYAYQTDGNGMVVLDANGQPVVDTYIGEDGNERIVRRKDERTDFRLIPLTVGAVYRFTHLDDRFRIPVVPYGKLALAYTIWSITKPGGGAAEVPTSGCPDLSAGCDGDVARGGSLGFEATAGIAVRAERLDPDSAVSLRNEMGIEHAGFFVELALSKVDGFGSDKKLSVGDFAWYGGINFEF